MTFSKLGTDTQTGQLVYLPKPSRLQGLYIIGIQGTGKSGLIENLIMQDIDQQIGVCVLDPHGELIDHVLARLEPKHEKDVILLDISDEDYPFGLNLFTCSHPSSAKAVQEVVDQVMHVFEKLLGVSHDTPLILQYLKNCTYTLIANPGCTMAEIPLLLTDKNCRQHLVANVKRTETLTFWRDYDAMPLSEQRKERSSSLRRVEEFLQDLTKPIVGQSTTTIDLQKIMSEGKILLVKLSAQVDSVSSLIGSLMIALILNAAYNRPAQRRQFHLYADEFQRFATEDFATLLEEARKFGIGTTIAHQNRGQLNSANSKLETDLKDRSRSVGNLVVFKINSKDADDLAGEFDTTPPPGDPVREQIMKRATKVNTFQVWEPPEKEKEFNLGWYQWLKTEHQAEQFFSFLRSLTKLPQSITSSMDSRPDVYTEAQYLVDELRNMTGEEYNRALYNGSKMLFSPYFHEPFDGGATRYVLSTVFPPGTCRDDIFHRVKPRLQPQQQFLFPSSFLSMFESCLQLYLQVAKESPPAFILVYMPEKGEYTPEIHIQALEELLAEYRAFAQPLKQQAYCSYDPTGSAHYLQYFQYVWNSKLNGYSQIWANVPPDPRHLMLESLWTVPLFPEAVEWIRTKVFQLADQLEKSRKYIELLQETYFKTKVEVIDLGYDLPDNEFVGWRPLGHGLDPIPIEQPRYRYKPGQPTRTVQDMKNNRANQLVGLPDFTATVKIKITNGISEHTIKTLEPEKGLYGKALQERIARIQTQNRTDGYTRERTGVEAEILLRQQSCSSSPPAQPQQPQHPSPQQPPPRHSRQVPVQGKCSSCGASNSAGAKHCNQCGAKL